MFVTNLPPWLPFDISLRIEPPLPPHADQPSAPMLGSPLVHFISCVSALTFSRRVPRGPSIIHVFRAATKSLRVTSIKDHVAWRWQRGTSSWAFCLFIYLFIYTSVWSHWLISTLTFIINSFMKRHWNALLLSWNKSKRTSPVSKQHSVNWKSFQMSRWKWLSIYSIYKIKPMMLFEFFYGSAHTACVIIIQSCVFRQSQCRFVQFFRSKLMTVNETKWQSVSSAVCSAHLLRPRAPLIHTSGLSLAAASSWLATLVLFRIFSSFVLPACIQKNKSNCLLFALTKLMSDCRERERMKKRQMESCPFPSQLPLTEKQGTTREAFVRREDISFHF